MNNQMLFMFVGGLVALIVVLLVVFMPSMETYTKTKEFDTEDNIITMDNDGNIKLQPIVNIDNAINTTADSVLSDVSAGYWSKQMQSDYNRDNIRAKYQLKTDAAQTVANIARDYQPKGDYVKRDTNYAIKMGPGSHASGDRYMVGSKDNWRVAYNGNQNSKWKLI